DSRRRRRRSKRLDRATRLGETGGDSQFCGSSPHLSRQTAGRYRCFQPTTPRSTRIHLVRFVCESGRTRYRQRLYGGGSAVERAQSSPIINTIPTAAWTTRPDGYCDFLNQVWFDYTGMTAEQAQGWGWTAALHPDDRIGLLEYWRSVLASGKRGEIEGRLHRNDGAYRWFLFRAEPFCDENGKVVRWYGTNTDIEDLKQAEYLLAAEKHALEMIADGASLSDILNHVCTSMDLLVAPSMTTILLMDPDGKRLWHIAGPRVPREWVPIISPLPVALEAGLCGTAAFLKERIVVPDVATDPNWPDRLRPIAIRNGIRAGWSEPIVAKDRQVLGT